MAKVAVIYYSATGHVHAMARAVEEGAASAGAEVRRRHVAELAPEEAIAQNQEWAAHRDEVKDDPLASLDDLEWCDAYILGSPTRFGNVSSQLKQFMDTAGGLWAQGKLADKVYAAFTSSNTLHGGQETTLVSLYFTLIHFGGIIVPPGYTDPCKFVDGNPYGVSLVTTHDNIGEFDEATDTALAHLARRVVTVAGRLTK